MAKAREEDWIPKEREVLGLVDREGHISHP